MQEKLPPIHFIRRQRVMLDSDLAKLYGVPTHRLNEAIKRNVARFPPDFRFQITREEYSDLVFQPARTRSQAAEEKDDAARLSQIAITSANKFRAQKHQPWVFTEHGALMAATVLRSARAVQMSLFVVRAFVQMREELLAHATVFKRLAEIDKRLVTHDVILRDVYEKLRPLLSPPETARKEMGFHTLIGPRKLARRK